MPTRAAKRGSARRAPAVQGAPAGDKLEHALRVAVPTGRAPLLASTLTPPRHRATVHQRRERGGRVQCTGSTGCLGGLKTAIPQLRTHSRVCSRVSLFCTAPPRRGAQTHCHSHRGGPGGLMPPPRRYSTKAHRFSTKTSSSALLVSLVEYFIYL